MYRDFLFHADVKESPGGVLVAVATIDVPEDDRLVEPGDIDEDDRVVPDKLSEGEDVEVSMTDGALVIEEAAEVEKDDAASTTEV
jgi:hypothetical protein